MQIQPSTNNYRTKQSFKAMALNETGEKLGQNIIKAIKEAGTSGDILLLRKTETGQPKISIYKQGELYSSHGLEGYNKLPFEHALLDLIQQAGQILSRNSQA